MPEKRVDGYAGLRTEDDFKGFFVEPQLTKERQVFKMDFEKDWDFVKRIERRKADLEGMVRHDYDNPVFGAPRVVFNQDRTQATIIVSLLKGKLKEDLR